MTACQNTRKKVMDTNPLPHFLFSLKRSCGCQVVASLTHSNDLQFLLKCRSFCCTYIQDCSTEPATMSWYKILQYWKESRACVRHEKIWNFRKERNLPVPPPPSSANLSGPDVLHFKESCWRSLTSTENTGSWRFTTHGSSSPTSFLFFFSLSFSSFFFLSVTWTFIPPQRMWRKTKVTLHIDM